MRRRDLSLKPSPTKSHVTSLAYSTKWSLLDERSRETLTRTPISIRKGKLQSHHIASHGNQLLDPMTSLATICLPLGLSVDMLLAHHLITNARAKLQKRRFESKPRSPFSSWIIGSLERILCRVLRPFLGRNINSTA